MLGVTFRTLSFLILPKSDDLYQQHILRIKHSKPNLLICRRQTVAAQSKTRVAATFHLSSQSKTRVAAILRVSNLQSATSRGLAIAATTTRHQVVMVSDQSVIRMSSRDGTISADEFYSAACAFVELWKTHNDALPQWSWVSCPKIRFTAASNVDGYLALENLVLPKSVQEDYREESYTREDECNYSNEDEVTDDAILVQVDDHERHHYDFHIVYNPSYRVPVLYLRAYNSDGQPLALDVIEKDVSANSGEVLKRPKWMFMTQEEHPLLNRPWCMLHPCGTSDLMKLLFSAEASATKFEVSFEKYLVSWFTVVGQLFGLKVPVQMLGIVDNSNSFT